MSVSAAVAATSAAGPDGPGSGSAEVAEQAMRPAMIEATILGADRKFTVGRPFILRGGTCKCIDFPFFPAEFV